MSAQSAYFLDGERVDPAAAAVALGSPGFAYAVCVFEGISAHWESESATSRLFRAEDHVARLLASTEAIGLKPPWSANALLDGLDRALVEAALRADGHLRVMVWADGATEIDCSEPVRTGVILRPLLEGRGPLTRPAILRTTSVERASDRVLPASVKATAHYLIGRRAALEARRQGAEPVLRNSGGCLAEAATANLFLVINGRLVTPSLDQSILPGITRDTVIQLAARLGLETEERPVHPEEVQEADEAFLTGSLCEVRPVAEFDGRRLASLEVRSITQRLVERYTAAVRGGAEQWIRAVRVGG